LSNRAITRFARWNVIRHHAKISADAGINRKVAIVR
jgi:hypothetical protein